MNDQLAFSHLLAEADERARAIRDRHLGRVQQFFDALSEEQKYMLARYMAEHEYDTLLALSVACGDWFREHSSGGIQ